MDFGIDRIWQLIRLLRDPEKGCPWDREQTLESLTTCLLEESWEVVDAIKNKTNLREELGDLLMLFIFLCQLADEFLGIKFSEVVESLEAKIVRKHPHVFGSKTLTKEEVLKAWEDDPARIFKIPRSLPSILRAKKLLERLARKGWELADKKGSVAHLQNEISQLKSEENESLITEAIGRSFLHLLNLCRLYNVDADIAINSELDKLTNSFISRASNLN
mgnify:CR=1 FL=1